MHSIMLILIRGCLLQLRHYPYIVPEMLINTHALLSSDGAKGVRNGEVPLTACMTTCNQQSDCMLVHVHCHTMSFVWRIGMCMKQ